jgi:hypothetical protein
MVLWPGALLIRREDSPARARAMLHSLEYWALVQTINANNGPLRTVPASRRSIMSLPPGARLGTFEIVAPLRAGRERRGPR